MLFVTGTPNLVGFTRDLLDDPSTAPAQMFSTQNIKDMLNVVYTELRDKARFVGDGHLLKVTYANATDGTSDYAFPTDLVKFRSVELELDGGDLSSLSPSAANIRVLEPADYTTAYQAYNTELVVDPRFYAIKDRNYSILAPPDTTGSSAIRIVYEAATALLSADGDEPAISRAFHDLLCRKAAQDLLATKNMDNAVLSHRTAVREAEFMRFIAEEMWSPDSQFVTAGLDDQTEWQGRHGYIDW